MSKSRKRSHAPPIDDRIYSDLSEQLKEIAVALKAINQGPNDFNHIYSKVMAMAVEGYIDDMLASAFDHLCENKKAAKAFLAKTCCRHHILHHLRLRPPFSNDDKILKRKVGLRPD